MGMSGASTSIKKIGVLSSGGDAPGMNAAIRAVVRAAKVQGLEVVGVLQGYTGLVKGQVLPLDLRSVANILQRGGTILKSGRCPDFHRPEVRAQAATHLRSQSIDALVVIGGDGSFRGAHSLFEEHQIPIIGVPGTIDNDVPFTDSSIGFDTAINTALEAIDRIRDTAASHDRLFIVEVMGRDSGVIAAHVGLAGGAEEVIVPEQHFSIDKAIEHIQRGIQRGKTSSILVAAEGQKPGRAYDLAEALRKKAGLDAKVCILGHIQRGGAPTAVDRVLASRLGAGAVSALLSGHKDAMVGIENGKLNLVPLTQVVGKRKSLPTELMELATLLAN